MDESPSEPLTELLGESGDINQADSCGRTVLHTLAADGNASLLELALATCPQVRIILTRFLKHVFICIDRHGCIFQTRWTKIIELPRKIHGEKRFHSYV